MSKTLLPVALAARRLYERAYGAPPPDAHLAERLNGLAYLLARFGRVYALEPGRPAPRRLAREEIARGHFRHGGTELHFLDARAPIRELGVAEESIERALSALRNRAGTS